MALEGHKDLAENREFRLRNGQMTTYNQEKLCLSAYYDKPSYQMEYTQYLSSTSNKNLIWR